MRLLIKLTVMVLVAGAIVLLAQHRQHESELQAARDHVDEVSRWDAQEVRERGVATTQTIEDLKDAWHAYYAKGGQ